MYPRSDRSEIGQAPGAFGQDLILHARRVGEVSTVGGLVLCQVSDFPRNAKGLRADYCHLQIFSFSPLTGSTVQALAHFLAGLAEW
jgi:hypothetical protein